MTWITMALNSDCFAFGVGLGFDCGFKLEKDVHTDIHTMYRNFVWEAGGY